MEITPDGWMVPGRYWNYFRLVTSHEPPRPGELQRSCLDPARARDALGFQAETSLEEGLAATWRWLAGDGAEASK